jgi:hypothetical protein
MSAAEAEELDGSESPNRHGTNREVKPYQLKNVTFFITLKMDGSGTAVSHIGNKILIQKKSKVLFKAVKVCNFCVKSDPSAAARPGWYPRDPPPGSSLLGSQGSLGSLGSWNLSRVATFWCQSNTCECQSNLIITNNL